mmetsp:Transcript_8573/g.13242  ORF Transcript_8573/g.13242 Transcript_8573/m.13242 type:complete len:93 (+) Transcript_8573:2-280(+)
MEGGRFKATLVEDEAQIAKVRQATKEEDTPIYEVDPGCYNGQSFALIQCIGVSIQGRKRVTIRARIEGEAYLTGYMVDGKFMDKNLVEYLDG